LVTRLKYFLSETLQNFKRNVLMSVAAISTVAISLLLLGGVLILGMIIGNVTASWEAKVEISVFLRDDATTNEIRQLQSQVTSYPEVQEVTYVSKQDAFEEFKQLYKDQPELWEAIPEDSLPASLRIKLTDAAFTDEVASRIEGAPGIDEVSYGGSIVRRLLQINSLLRSITFAMSLILMIAASGLIANSIRLAIYARREEIGIMKLVGATNWFIRVPFMLEGLGAAMVGALLAGLVVIGANELLFSRVDDVLPFMGPILSFSFGDMLGVVVVLVVVGGMVGIVGSVMALRRFLEV
jgi:cell division transport system permease protein